MRNLYSSDAFTGLEAAIVLIAFVVVAAVFSYVVLGAGFFTTQKAQATVHTGVQQASSTLEVVGNVYGIATTHGTSIQKIKFSLALAPGGTPVDFSKVVMTYSTSKTIETLPASSTATIPQTLASPGWAITAVQNQVTADLSLEMGEQFDITAQPTSSLSKNDQFTIEIKPAVGAAFSVVRTAPASIQPVNLLY